MLLNVSDIDNDDWVRLGSLLRKSGYTTGLLRELLELPDSVEEIISNPARYSVHYMNELSRINAAGSALVRLFLLSGQISVEDFRKLPPVLASLLCRLKLVEQPRHLDNVSLPESPILRRLRLAKPVARSAGLLCATVSITEYKGCYFLSDPLFSSRPSGFTVYRNEDRCTPPHATSLGLLGDLRKPAGATSFLDVGCGSGCQSIIRAADYARVVGFDILPRAIEFAQVNALINGASVCYVVDSWESFTSQDPFDHIVFNAPNSASAFRFINSDLDRLLSGSGSAQINLVHKITEEDGVWRQVLERLVERRKAWYIDSVMHEDSPFSIPRDAVSEGRVPHGNLLVDNPSENEALTRNLAEQRVVEIVNVTVSLRRRALMGQSH
jgi:SAM-dependent methyltransferase